MFSVEGYENSFVENSNVPIGWIFECLDKNSPSFKKIKGDSKILKLNVEDISGGKGYASKVYKSTVHFEGDENKTYEFILKIPGIESFSDLFENETDKADITETFDIETVATFHNQETVFYTMTTKEIEDLKVPSCYGGRGLIPHKQDGCLIMEFLSPSSDNIPYYQSFNVYQAKSMLEEIMKLQVFSLTDGKHWKSKFKPLFNRKVFKSLVKLINTGFNHFKEIFPKEMVNEIEADFKTYVSKYDDIGMYSIEGIPDCRGHNSVLCHGDLWTNNIMFEVDSERRFTNDVKVVIDWQSIYQGCVGADIARLIVSGCSPEVRREIELDVKDISDGKGFASKVYKSTVHFENGTVYQFILKVPVMECLDELIENESNTEEFNEVINMETMSIFHHREYIFLTQTMKDISDLKAPSCYGGRDLITNKQDGCLIMEFLSPISDTIPFYQSFNIYQVKSVLNEIMKLQVFSLTNGSHWKSTFQNLYDRKIYKSLVTLMEMGFNIFKETCPNEMLKEIEEDYKILVSKYEDIGMYTLEGLPDSKGKNAVIMFAVEGYDNEFVEKSNIPIGWIFDCLEKNCSQFRKIRGDFKILKLDVKDISGGKGFASKVYKSTAHFENGTVYQFILKVPVMECLDELIENESNTEEFNEVINMETMSIFHHREYIFLTQTMKDISDLKAPSCYGGRDLITNKQDGCLIMEFLSPISDTIPFYQSFNIYQVKSVLNEIMKLQVFSLTNGSHWKSTFQNLFDRKIYKSLVTLMDMGFNTFKEICTNEMLKEIEEDYKILISKYEDIGMYTLEGLPDSKGKNAVLCHGDLWTNNLMFKVDSERRFTNNIAAIIDWQVILTGSVAADIARLIVTGCSPEIRREIEVSYLPTYFEELKRKVSDKGGEFNMSFDAFMNAYNFCMIDQSFHTFLLLGINLQKTIITSEEDNYVWEARKFSLVSKAYFAMKDAIKRIKKVKPEWLEK
uniref:CHK domain-containing protein n=1 Tax=Parastrongyloides trichosuri TaxID=131310 RepID=A0A0N4ZDU7_PARTI